MAMMITAKLQGGFICSLLAMLLATSSTTVAALPAMIPMEQVGPQPRSYSDKTHRSVPLRPYAQVIHVAPGAEHKMVAAALASVKDASAKKRYAILVAAGTYNESRIQMKPWVDLFGGYPPGDWKNGGGITARGNVQAKILRNVFCNNIAGVKDDTMFHRKVGSRSSPGGAIACSEESSPQISFNVIVMCSAPINNDAGGVWVEGNSIPLINYNWVVGNTSGDDGGGIYCMGNLYYTDAGERFDISPDAAVPVEDNLIAGNNTVRGGPGGVRASRFGRIDLRRNTIVANEKGGAHAAEGAVLSVVENNIMEDNGAKRTPATPKFRLTGEISNRNFDARSYVTEIDTSD